MINQQILESIEASTLVFADVTGKSLNCYFEIGYALALKTPLILAINGEDLPIPFDLAGKRFIIWSGEKKKAAG